MATETYALASFVTSGGVVAASKLQAEISASAAIPIQITGVTVDVECRIDFQATLDAGQKSALDALVAAHTGVQEAQPPTLVDIAGPKESDGKQIVVISPATEGFKTWLTSRGDDVNLGAAGRGKGVRLAIEFDGTDPLPVTKTIESAWLDPMEVHDGQFNWTPAAFDHTDEFSVSVVMPGNVATPSPGVGNVNAIALGGGAELYILRPATDHILFCFPRRFLHRPQIRRVSGMWTMMALSPRARPRCGRVEPCEFRGRSVHDRWRVNAQLARTL